MDSQEPASVSQELNCLRETQSIGILLIAIGGFISFVSFRAQIPLYAKQAAIVHKMQQQIKRLEKKSGDCPNDLMY